MGVVVDSSVFIAAERGRFDWIGFHSQIGSELLFLTSVTLAELMHGVERADSPERRAARLQFVSEIEARYPLLSFARQEALEYASLWARLGASGTLIGTHDLLIAAIARTHDFRVATLNVGEFNRVPNLEVMDASAFRLSTRKN
ncbi:MAG: PIN domain-containing protein [Chthoniobacteraceae bacterium]